MRIAVAQLDVTRDLDRARALASDAAASAASSGARLLVLPEYSSGFDPRGVDRDLAQPAGGSFEQRLAELSEQHSLCIVAGVVREHGEKLTNTLVALDRGELVAQYDKIHLFDAFGTRESDTFAAGAIEQRGTFGCDQFTVGLQTCYDLRFPEITRKRVLEGASIVVNPAAWVAGPNKLAHWRTLIAARAIENTCVMVGASMAGRGVIGHSLVVGADGTIRAELGAEPGLAVVDIEQADIELTRNRNPSLRNRRMGIEAPGQ
ncbi:nitrilase-related carbon-nitrogen hydrolase [Timonella senegalensis]|uniref:nitrilase-related carbon-nitrogen hydrolase n=1 Tax=Timonella senegalensis TaxID=1465825 RepID=UPI0028A84447|nr:nitrilase-related carbon-nitrogen hydrolase [Timonella senegalensis]